MNDKDKIIDELERNEGFEELKDLESSEWTEEYREGFVDGLKRAKEIVEYII